MAKGAANETTLGGLHSLLARVFERTLKKYLRELEAIEELNQQDLENELLLEAMSRIGEPNPAMLSALSKFLKDNEIGLDSAEVEQLNATQRHLQDARERRAKAGVNLSVVPLVADGS